MHADGLPWTISLPTTMFTAQAVFCLQHERTDTDVVTDGSADATKRLVDDAAGTRSK